jgi:hypothetical protein
MEEDDDDSSPETEEPADPPTPVKPNNWDREPPPDSNPLLVNVRNMRVAAQLWFDWGLLGISKPGVKPRFNHVKKRRRRSPHGVGHHDGIRS